jgi:hypothetical protein
MENADTVFLGKVNVTARDQHDLPDTGIFGFGHQQSVCFMVDIKGTGKHKDFFDILDCSLDNRGFMPIADDPSHLGLEMSDFLFVPGDDPYGSSFADQPFDELSTNISGGAGYKNHWCSPF